MTNIEFDGSDAPACPLFRLAGPEILTEGHFRSPESTLERQQRGRALRLVARRLTHAPANQWGFGSLSKSWHQRPWLRPQTEAEAVIGAGNGRNRSVIDLRPAQGASL
jgi:hypothetical protein